MYLTTHLLHIIYTHTTLVIVFGIELTQSNDLLLINILLMHYPNDRWEEQNVLFVNVWTHSIYGAGRAQR